jgi:hypothetical protein
MATRVKLSEAIGFLGAFRLWATGLDTVSIAKLQSEHHCRLSGAIHSNKPSFSGRSQLLSLNRQKLSM